MLELLEASGLPNVCVMGKDRGLDLVSKQVPVSAWGAQWHCGPQLVPGTRRGLRLTNWQENDPKAIGLTQAQGPEWH